MHNPYRTLLKYKSCRFQNSFMLMVMATDYKQKKSVFSLSQVTPTSQMGAKPNERKQEEEQPSI